MFGLLSICKGIKNSHALPPSKANPVITSPSKSHMPKQTIPLREQHPTAYNSWRNMKQRVKADGGIVHREFENFSSFLDAVGLPPTDKHTLDRIDNNLGEYTPDNCRWASKREQSANRRNTIFLEVNGIRQSLTDWAEDTGQKPNTLRTRRKKGWSDKEVIYGRRRSTKSLNETSRPDQLLPDAQKFKNLQAHNCHVSLKWPWLNDVDAKHFEDEYLSTSKYPETRYEYFERVSGQQLEGLEKVISQLSRYCLNSAPLEQIF